MKAMKLILRTYRWIIISVLLQIVVLLYLNNYYLVKGVSIKATSYEVKEEQPVIEDTGLKISSDAKDVKVSFDGSYVAYMLGGSLNIKDIKSEKDKNAIGQGDGIIDYYKWLPDRNMIIYSIKSDGEENSRIQVFTKDIENGLDHSYPKISGLSKDSEVLSIELSPLTNAVYAKIKSSSTQAKLYKFDTMSYSYYIMNMAIDGSIKETTYKDSLLYDDIKKNKVRVWDGKSQYSWDLPFKEKIVLLGIDAEDNAYVGEIGTDDKVSRIFFGKLARDSHESWKQIDLKEPADSSSIIIASNGQIYRLDDDKKVITNIQNEKQIEFSGDFIEMLDDYTVYLNKNRLKLDAISK